MKPLRYYSEKKSRVSGSNLEFFDFVPREGPTGGRVVIDGFYVYCDTQFDITVQTQEGEDQARFIANARVEEMDGTVRWNLPGDASRIMAYLLLGADKVTEQADIAVANNNTQLLVMYIPMTKPLTHSPEDFALPADEFRKFVVQCYTDAGIATAGTTYATDSATYYIVADCHEEHDLQFHCKDEVKMDELTSTTEGKVAINGLLHDLVLHAAGSSGGAALTNLTDVRIDTENLLEVSTKKELLAEYRHRRGVAANLNSTMGGEVRADPFAVGKACPVLFSDHRTSAWAGKFLRQIKINLTNSVASLRAITRVVKPAQPQTRNAIASAYGVTDMAAVTVKTDKKTKRGLHEWPAPLRPYLPLKAPLRKAV